MNAKVFDTPEDRLREIQLYEQVALEISNNQQVAGVWAQALSESSGDEGAAKALYIKLRVQMIKDELAYSQEVEEKRAAEKRREARRAAERREAQRRSDERTKQEEEENTLDGKWENHGKPGIVPALIVGSIVLVFLLLNSMDD